MWSIRRISAELLDAAAKGRTTLVNARFLSLPVGRSVLACATSGNDEGSFQ